jgi:uncharacterized delta-60 repeat protein
MTTSYKVLGQGVDYLKYSTNEDSSAIISKLKIKNTSYPGRVSVSVSDNSSIELSLDESFPNAGNGSPYSIVFQPNRKILLVGSFTTIDGTTRNRIARLNSDGTLDTVFNPNANALVSAIAIQPDGKIVVAGQFTSIGDAAFFGSSRNYLARLNPDGSVDFGFNPNANNYVNEIAIQPDGKILVGGQFTSIGGGARAFFARLNSDGTLDTGFTPPNSEYGVIAIALQPDGKIVAGGLFATPGGATSYSRIVRLNPNGSLDTGFNSNRDLSNSNDITSFAIQSDGKILVTSFGSVPTTLERLNSNGVLDTSFNPANNGTVSAIAIQPDGKIFIGGEFTTIGGVARSRIARLNSDGTLDAGFRLPTLTGFGANVHSIALSQNGHVVFGGNFVGIGSVTRSYLARLKEPLLNSSYLIKNKEILFDESIEISGGIVIDPDSSLIVESESGENIVIQAYGIEETV